MANLHEWLARRGLDILLTIKSRPGLVASALGRHTFRPAPPLISGRVTVGLAQMRLDLAGDAVDYGLNAYRLVRAAVERGAQFVVLPEYTGAPLLGLLPGVRDLAAQPSMQDAIDQLAGGSQVSVGDVFRAIAPAAGRIYRETFSTLARRFRAHILAGSIILPGRDGRLYSLAHLFGPTGQLLGIQSKLHLFPDEKGWLTPGSDLRVFNLPFGRVAAPICMDYTFWETSRLAALQGAEILVDPAADSSGEHEWMAARGVRMRVQEVDGYGLHVFMIADVFGLNWRGRSCVYAPPGLLPPGQSVLARAECDDQQEVVICDLDMQALRRFRASRPLELNVPLYEKYLGLYSERRRDSGVSSHLQALQNRKRFWEKQG